MVMSRLLTLLIFIIVALVFAISGIKQFAHTEIFEANIESTNKQDLRIHSSVINNPIHPLIDTSGYKVSTRFKVPTGFTRVKSKENSFQSHLQSLPLKSHGQAVLYYNGDQKPNKVHAAVVNLEIGKENLHQCADAVMRLRADYLWQSKQYDKIHFNFTNGMRVEYSEWMKGKRMNVEGNKTNWYQSVEPSNTYKDYWKYMELIFNYAGTYSLSKELKKQNMQDISIGDVFILGGFPGHAVIVVDMATQNEKNEKIFLLAQSYMPAQEIHILNNPANEDMNPWYTLKLKGAFETPEWNFDHEDLKRFVD